MEFLFLLVLGKPLWMWLLFITLVVALLAFDLGVLHKDDHEIGIAESLKLSAMYITLGIAFSGFIYWTMGGEATAQYLTAFIVEKTLAMDNIFVIALIFSFFAIPREYQHRVLFWGILGVILLRGIMIGLGATIVENYHWVLYLFAAFLIFTGIKMLFASDDHTDMADNKALNWLRRRMRVTDELHGHAFTVKIPDPKTGKPVSVRLGRFGPYAAIGSTAEDAEDKPKFASLRPGQSMHTITLEQALDFIEDDELVEVTPKEIRLRKKLLTESDRKRASRAA